METLEPPKIPLALVEWLEALALRAAPYASSAGEAALRAYVAEVNLVRKLRAIYEEQTNPSED